MNSSYKPLTSTILTDRHAASKFVLQAPVSKQTASMVKHVSSSGQSQVKLHRTPATPVHNVLKDPSGWVREQLFFSIHSKKVLTNT